MHTALATLTPEYADTPSEVHVIDAAPACPEISTTPAVESESSIPPSHSKSVPHLRHLVESMARLSGMPASTCHTLCQTILETVFDCLTREESLTLRGLGTFGVRRHGARMGRNPLTGEALHIPAGKKARFTVDKQLHAQINRKAQAQARQTLP